MSFVGTKIIFLNMIFIFFTPGSINNRNYGNADFISGPEAEVEYLWSRMDKLIDGSCSSALPVLMESLLFLKANRELCCKETIVIASNKSKNLCLKSH